MKSKVSMVLFIVVIAIVSVFGVYLVLPDNSINANKINYIAENNYSREDFYTEYLNLVLNEMNGEDTDETNEILSNSVTQTGSISNNTNASVNKAELSELSKQLASTFKNSSGNYAYGGTHKLQNDLTLCGRTLPKGTVIRHDCSGLVSAMCYFMGVDSSYKLRVSNGFKDFPRVNTETFENARVGDIMCTEAKGHVAIIVKVDNENVYFADCGSTNAITKTATNGYYQSFKKTAKVSSWRKEQAYLHRPSW